MQEDELRIPVDVGEIGSVNALIFSGTDVCVIRKDLLTASIISKIEPVTGIIILTTLPGGIQTVVIGWVELLVTCLGKTVKMPFMVVPQCSCSIFLGANWIRRSRAILKSDGNGFRVTFDGIKEKKEYRTSYRCSPPCVKVYVDEIGVVSAIVDTCSSMSTVREDWLTHNQMLEATVPHYMMTNIANGTDSNKMGLVSLNITPLQDQNKITIRIETVEVALNLSQPLILGMDWIYKTRATIQSDGSNIIVLLQPKMKMRERFVAWLTK